MIKNWGLKRKFITVFMIIIVPIILFGILIYYFTTLTLKEQAIEEAMERLEKNEQNLTSVISTVESMSSYMIYNQDFRTFFTTPEQDFYKPEYKAALEAINGYFTFQLMSNEYILSITLEGEGGEELKHGDPIVGDEQELDRVAVKSEGIPVWSNAYQVTSDWNGQKYVVSLSRVINDLNRINEPIGMVRIRLDGSKLYDRIELPSQQGDYLVMSENGEIILSHDTSLIGKKYPNSEFLHWATSGGSESSYNYKTKDNNIIAVKNKLEGINWLSIITIDQGKLVGELYTVRTFIGSMTILLILLGIVSFIVFYRSNIKRIIELTNQTKQVEKGDFTASVKVDSHDEIGKLGMRFNRMMKTIRRYIDIEYNLKMKQKESELKTLQNQIDPHFLYNTLDMIRWNARLENAMKTGHLIELLSKHFRMNLNNGKIWIMFKEEIEYIEAYLELHKSRLGGRLSYHISIEDQLKTTYIMKQLIQPLVENSIQHGFKNMPGTGIIIIRCYRVDNEVRIDVHDNGWGLSKKVNDQHSGYALSNLKDRISIAFGKQYSLRILDNEQGATVRLVLPILNEEKLKEVKEELGE